MKKALFFITIMFVFTSLASAQTSFFASDDTISSGDSPIVRSWDNKNAAITYFIYKGKNYVQYVNYQTGDSYRCRFPDSISIYDMYIHDDTVYYCGSWTIDSVVQGIVGYFDPAEFLSSQVQFNTLPVPPLTLVNKLVAQDEPNGTGVEVIALGEHRWTDTIEVGNEHQLVHHLNRLFFFCNDITQNYVTYDTLLYNPIPGPPEVYYDVLLTDTYIVFVGHVTVSGSCVPCIRIRKRNDATLPGDLDYLHFFYTGTFDVHSPMHSTSMDKDTIATAYMHTDASTGVVSNIVRVIDVHSMVMVNSQEYVVPDKSEVTDIVYIPKDRSLVCMHDFETPLNAFNTNFVYLDPHATTPYSPNIEYIKNEFFKSLTRRADRQYLASMGPRWFLKDKLSLGAYQNTDCPVTEKIESNILANVLVISPYLPLTINTPSNQIIINIQPTETRLVSKICVNP